MKRATPDRSEQIRDDIEDVTRFLIMAAKMNAVDGTYDEAACRLLDDRHLFAAAPDLLAAVEGLLAIVGQSEGHAVLVDDYEWDVTRWPDEPAVAAARAALAKARGEEATS